MTIYCLTHHHGHGSDAYLFKAVECPDPDVAAEQLELCIDPGEQVDIAVVCWTDAIIPESLPVVE